MGRFALAILLAALAWGAPPLPANSELPAPFTVVPLGVAGGRYEGNLSSYLVASPYSRGMVLLDAGTVMTGLEAAVACGALRGLALPPEAEGDAVTVLRDEVAGVLLSHAHLDHVAGLVIASADDSPKAVYGLPATIDALRDHLFNWAVWPNFADEGEEPRLGRYRYARLERGLARDIPGTPFTVEALPLGHGAAASTLFLLGYGDAKLAYFGDTGPDAVEGGGALLAAWERLAPLMRQGRLRAILIEVSFDSARPDDLLFGHLTPRWLLAELRRLAVLAARLGEEPGLYGLQVVVTHVKPVDGEPFDATRARIMRELEAGNDLGARFILPEQGEPLYF